MFDPADFTPVPGDLCGTLDDQGDQQIVLVLGNAERTDEEKDGNGNGNGNGDGNGYGSGDGTGYGNGDGNGSGYGDGNGSGSGSGYEDKVTSLSCLLGGKVETIYAHMLWKL
jgi:hypothetical protein